MNIFKKIIGLSSVMEDEVRSFRLLFLQSLFIGFASSYYYIVSSSFLLKNISIKNLPTAYIITGTAGFLMIRLYKNIQKKFGIPRSYKVSIVVFSIICFMNFFAMLELSDNKMFSVFLAYFMVLFAGPFVTIFSLGLFAQCSRLYNIAQSKRLLALVISGEIISSIIAYLTITFLGGLIKGHIYALLAVAGVFSLLIFLPFSKLLKISADRFHLPVVRKAAVKVDLAFFKKEKFYMLIAITTVFSVFAIYVVDYAYLISVRYMSAISGLEIAQIVAVFFFTVKIGELSFSFLSGRILSTKGVKFSLLLLPAILLLFSVFAFVSGFLFHGEPLFLLCFLLLGKLTERAIRKAITTPSVKVMYQVAEPHDRLEIEASIDGLLNQIATVVSGVVLLIISVAFFGDNMFNLLHLFSFVCIAAFALWSLFSLRMYDSYRVKIKDFLYRIKSAVHGGHAKNAQEEIEEDTAVLSEDNLLLVEKVHEAVHAVNNARRDDLLGLIKIYNPKQSMDFHHEKMENISKRLVHIYYSNNFYFSRLLIIKYITYFDPQTAYEFLKELWDVSDLTCKLELILSYNEREHKNPDHIFFERQCEECVREMIWLEATLYDVASLKNEELEAELHHHRSVLTDLLFQLLKPIYDPGIIQVIYDIITKNSGDIENQLFALELLDITLQPALKEIIKPVVEPIPFEDKKAQLDKLFHIYHFSAEDRLVDIMMKDYNLVSLRLKEMALIVYNKISDEKSVLSAFRTNSIDNLKYRADEMFTGVADPYYQAKMEVLKRVEYNYAGMKSFGPCLLNYGISVPRQRHSNNSVAHKLTTNQPFIIDIRPSSNILVKLDSLALALLLTMKQCQLTNVAKPAEA